MPKPLPHDVQAVIDKAARGEPLSAPDKKILQEQLNVTPPVDPNWKILHELASTGPATLPGVSLPGGGATPVQLAPNTHLISHVGDISPSGASLPSLAGSLPPAAPTGGSILDALRTFGGSGHPAPGPPISDIFAKLLGAGGNGDPNSPVMDVTANIASGQYTGPGAPAGSASGSDPNETAADLAAAGSDIPISADPNATSPLGVFAGQLGGAAYLDPNTYQGYTFYQMSPYMRAMLLTDPSGAQMEALALAQQQGGGRSSAAFMQPYVDAALKLAEAGALGGPNTTPGRFGGPASSEATLKQAEDFINAANSGQQVVNPAQLMAAVLQQAIGTPNTAEGFQRGRNPKAVDLQDPNDEIQITNEAMRAAGQFLAPRAQKALDLQLQMAEINYKDALAHGQTSESYPEFLRSQGIVAMFGG